MAERIALVSDHAAFELKAMLVDERASITCNKNGIPFDPLPPVKTSGIRVASPAGRTRGFGVAKFRVIADLFESLRENGREGNAAIEAEVKARVRNLFARLPIHQDL